MADELQLEFASTRFYALLVNAYSLGALALTATGVFAMLSHLVARRRSEIGLRLALGGEGRTWSGLIARLTAVPLGLGVAAGWALATALSAGAGDCCSSASAASISPRTRSSTSVLIALRPGRGHRADPPGACAPIRCARCAPNSRPGAAGHSRRPSASPGPSTLRSRTLVQGAMANAARDLLQGFRLLWRAPGFAATASLTLALGIGATTTLFSVVHAVLIDPLPFPDSGKLIQVWRAELPALTYGSASYRPLPRLAGGAARLHRDRRLGAAGHDARRRRGARAGRWRGRLGRVLPRGGRDAGRRPLDRRRRGSAGAANASP